MSGRARWAVVSMLVACHGKDAGTTDAGTSYDFDCEVTDPYDLDDPFGPIAGHEKDCEQGAYYDPDVPTATSYFVGEFHMDDCGTVYGRETWILYPNETWESLGGQQCQVVWAASGTREDRVTIGSYSLNLSMVVDDDQTDCDDITDFEFDQTFGVVYDVAVAGGDSTVYFTPSGNVLGRGEANGNHVTYTSDVNCKLF